MGFEHGGLTTGARRSLRRRLKFAPAALGAAALAVLAGLPTSTAAQEPKPAVAAQAASPDTSTHHGAPERVAVNPPARDEEIRKRLQSILDATDWFAAPDVRVQEGVVFLSGQASSTDRKAWAGDLSRNTQDVVAVVNRMEVLPPSLLDLSPAWRGLGTLWRDFVRTLPLILVGLLILALSVGVGVITTRVARVFLRERLRARLLRNAAATGAGALVVLLGAYVILRVFGLTQLAFTVMGGTGLIGLAVGIAFRDITENFLASIFLSLQHPFETADLVEVAGVTGYVQQLNMRTTILMTLDGNLVQIPNASVYKSNLRNFTTIPNRREDFVVGIGYDDSIDEAQEIARSVLEDHPAVLRDPEPLVLADSLGSSTVNLRVYFWINGREHSWLKVRSSVIRLVKRAFQTHGISMPDEAREVVFPRGVPVTVLDEAADATREARPPAARAEPPVAPGHDAVSTRAEAGLGSEAAALEEQAKSAQPLRDGENLLTATSDGPAPGVGVRRPKA